MKKYGEYERGKNWINPEETLTYVHLPKCASTSIAMFLGLHGWQSTTSNKNLPAFTVIREPYDRYVSALRSVWDRMYKETKETKLPLGKWVSQIKRVKIYDEHTEKQSYLLEPFKKNLKHIITMENIDRLQELGIHLNIHQNRGNRKSIRIIKENLKLTKEEILAFYAEDDQLYRKVLREEENAKRNN